MWSEHEETEYGSEREQARTTAKRSLHKVRCLYYSWKIKETAVEELVPHKELYHFKISFHFSRASLFVLV
jgi:hypothetical protein